MATGGAKDVDNFRENISEGYLPGEDEVTTKGLLYDYYFDTSDDRDGSDSLFYPSYSTAISNHALTDQTEHYLTVGLNSTISVEVFFTQSRREDVLTADGDINESVLTDPTVYKSGIHFQFKYHLYHIGLLTHGGTDDKDAVPANTSGH